jgi:hypothetical protein
MPPTHRRRRAALPLTAAALAALLLTACSSTRLDIPWLRISLHVPGATAQPSAQAGTPPTITPASTPQAQTPQLTIEQFVPVAERFVEQHRGHTFKAPVQVTLLADADFRKRLLANQGDTSAIETTSKELKALHLINTSVDLNSAANGLLGAGVSGFYDYSSKSLVVRGVAATPYVREVLVHELTHALQDQYFGIHRPELEKANDERFAAFQAVFEGDAVRIQNEYHQAMTPQEQYQSDQEQAAQGGGVPGDTPRVLLEILSFPYVAGPRFVAALAQEGGTPAVDDAFVHPPVSTEQILNVNAYLAGRQPRIVAVPHADGTAFDHGVNGEFGLLLLFEAAGESPTEARGAADLWGGDEYVAWDHGAGACVRLATVADSTDDQPTLDSALSSYARSVGGTFTASPGGGAPSVVTACG